jgi:hypothetical protein
MSKRTPKSVLLPLVARLKAASSRDTSLSAEILAKTWGELRDHPFERSQKVNPSIMAGLIFEDARFAQLLNAEEYTQLQTLVGAAIQRFEQKINPSNKLGKTLAASIKESI